MAGATHWGLLGALDALRTPLGWPGRLLLIGPGGLGDTVLLWPMLQRLQQAAPHTQVTWMGLPAFRSVVAMMGVQRFQPVNDFTDFDPAAFDAIVSFADIAGTPFIGAPAPARRAAAPAPRQPGCRPVARRQVTGCETEPGRRDGCAPARPPSAVSASGCSRFVSVVSAHGRQHTGSSPFRRPPGCPPPMARILYLTQIDIDFGAGAHAG